MVCAQELVNECIIKKWEKPKAKSTKVDNDNTRDIFPYKRMTTYKNLQ